MKHKALVVKAIKAYIKRLSFDAILYNRGLCDTPHARNCAADLKKLLDVLAEMEM